MTPAVDASDRCSVAWDKEKVCGVSLLDFTLFGLFVPRYQRYLFENYVMYVYRN
jgi:hypothetical protein